MRILTEPKDALIRQFQKLAEYYGISVLALPKSCLTSPHECQATLLWLTWVCHALCGPSASACPACQNARSLDFEMIRIPCSCDRHSLQQQFANREQARGENLRATQQHRKFSTPAIPPTHPVFFSLAQHHQFGPQTVWRPEAAKGTNRWLLQSSVARLA